MYKLSALFILLFVSTSLLAQNTLRTVKVSVNEQIELKSTKAVYSITVKPHQDQLSDYMDKRYYNNYEEFDSYEQPVSYQEVEEGNLTDEEYQKKVDEYYQQKAQEEAEKRANFVSVREKDIMKQLKMSKLNFTTQTSLSQNRYDYEDARTMDTTIFVTVLSSSEYERMVAVLIDQPAYFRISSLEFEPIDKHLEKTIPVITQKAKKEANVLATSLGKKLGDIVECTNDKQNYPQNESYYRVDHYDRNHFVDPFEKTQPHSIQYVYTFELLN